MKKHALLAAACLSTITQNAYAQPVQDGWSFDVGTAAIFSPTYVGSDDYALMVVPNIRFAYEDKFFASVQEGMGYNMINTKNWQAGPIARIRFGRDAEDGGGPFIVTGENNDLQGTSDIDTAGEAGAFIQYTAHNIRTRIEVRQGFGGHDGLVADGSVEYVGRSGPIGYSIGPNISYGSDDFMQTYFGIDSTQSANSGLRQYSADGGIASYGIGAMANMPLTDNINLIGFAGYDRISGDAEDSPLVEDIGSANQGRLGFAIGYRF